MAAGERGRTAGRDDHFVAPEGPWPGQDWVAWLKGEAARLEARGGAAGRVAGAALRGVAGHARDLGARSPDEYERLAREEAEEEAAWVASLEADWDDFGGVWSLLAGPDGG